MEYMTAGEAADYLRISRATFYNHVSQGFIPYRINIHTGRKMYVQSDLDTVYVKANDAEYREAS